MQQLSKINRMFSVRGEDKLKLSEMYFLKGGGEDGGTGGQGAGDDPPPPPPPPYP